MDYFIASTDVSVNIPFIIDGDYFTPDDGTVTYTLRDNTGADVVGQVDIAVATPTGTTDINVNILATYNAKDSSYQFENRTLIVKGEVSGNAFQLQSAYRVVAIVPVMFDKERVRLLLGANSSEVPNSSIDIYISYFALLTAYGSAFTDALISGTSVAMSMENALYLKTALDTLPSLRLRVAKLVSDGLVKFTRFESINWEALRADLESQLGDALLEGGVVTTVQPVLSAFGTGTNYFAG